MRSNLFPFFHKKLLAAGCGLFVVLFFHVQAGALDVTGEGGAPFETEAQTAFLMDYETGTVLFSHHADRLIAPASMAKLMTQEVVFHEIQAGRLTLNTLFPISEHAWRKGGAPSGTSSMFAQLKSRVRVEDLLRGSIIVSANDACIALAEGISGSEQAFAQKMMERAKVLGLNRAHFTNPTGLPDPDLKVTPRELVVLAAHIIRTYPQFYPWYSEKEMTWTLAQPQRNRNPLLRDVVGADGLKTGYTSDAGYGLVGAVVRQKQRLVLMVGGLKSDKERSIAAKKLVEWGFSHFETRLILKPTDAIAQADVYGGSQPQVELTTKEPIYAVLQRQLASRDIHADIVYMKPIRAPIQAGQVVAQLRLYQGEQLILERPLVSLQAVEVGNFVSRARDAAFELVRGLF